MAPVIKARVPPSFVEGKQDNSWKSTPKDWLYGSWKMTHTSQEYYHDKTTNLTIQYAPVLNGTWPCANQELVTLLPKSQPERVYTAFGIDSPVPRLDDAWLGKLARKGMLAGVSNNCGQVQCTGRLSQISDYVAFLAWGSDTSHKDWVVMYSTPLPGATTGLPAQVSIMSRDSVGPDKETVESIKTALRELQDVELRDMVDRMKTLIHDCPDTGLVDCGYEVLQNDDSLTRF